MAGTSENLCMINGDYNICPGDISVSYSGEVTYLNADVSCPFDAVLQSNFIQASQNGVCNCTTAILTEGEQRRGRDGKPINCNCYACPLDPTPKVGYAFECDQPIVGPCKTFSCDGTCNGEFNIFDNGDTRAPTMAPTSASATSSSLHVTVLAVLCVLHMIVRR
mmetsp:Transcript_22635/g.63131  ORF Transcript_22635/g.63131 Transcript_22635/m.63131 type:complete len:164 (-) Transcript_22635:86-577(-)|eukprot:CAMPEP_0198110586 /NCGR_PEP_ID=MMETSP1442-20131203/2601_1 /TAXON_ID= /ORGANISM="Craspedostauros australis, Strain CCMP3328" /LENGTH=163 /DNA_ID=CAMNT_0043766709 /DNA_START=276 /DNA_END=767 /DNA_ORIENTATION=+